MERFFIYVGEDINKGRFYVSTEENESTGEIRASNPFAYSVIITPESYKYFLEITEEDIIHLCELTEEDELTREEYLAEVDIIAKTGKPL